MFGKLGCIVWNFRKGTMTINCYEYPEEDIRGGKETK